MSVRQCVRCAAVICSAVCLASLFMTPEIPSSSEHFLQKRVTSSIIETVRKNAARQFIQNSSGEDDRFIATRVGG